MTSFSSYGEKSVIYLICRRILGVKEQKCLVTCTLTNEELEPPFPKLSTFLKLVELLLGNLDLKMTQNCHIYVISGGPEVAGNDVLSRRNANILESYELMHFEAVS